MQLQGQLHVAGLRVLEDIVDRFLADPEQGDFHLAGQTPLVGEGPLHADASVTQAVGFFVERFESAEIIQDGRAQACDQLPAFTDGVLGEAQNRL